MINMINRIDRINRIKNNNSNNMINKKVFIIIFQQQWLNMDINWRLIIQQQQVDLAAMEQQDDVFGQIQRIQDPRAKQVKVSVEQRSEVHSIASKMHRVIELNHQIDNGNNAGRFELQVRVKNIEFDSFMMKSNCRTVLKNVLERVRQRLQGCYNGKVGYITDKESSQVMVVRFIEKEGNDGLFWMEDETGRQKIYIKRGIVWIGMIAAIETLWENNIYVLDKIVDLSIPIPQSPTIINKPMKVYRMMMLKGPFRKNDQDNDIGVIILEEELKKLRQKDKISVDCVVIMGPLLSIKNQLVQNVQLNNTFQEEHLNIIELISTKIKSVYPTTEICFVPGLEDVVNYYPLPQPSYKNMPSDERIHYLSNPSTIELIYGRIPMIPITILNYDLLQYIDNNKGGRHVIQARQENFQTYLKQPFTLTNASLNFDTCNLPKLYNGGQFSDIIVMSSQDSPPYVNDIKDKLIVNIGSLGMDYHITGKHHITLLSIYEGQGPINTRTKVQFIHN